MGYFNDKMIPREFLEIYDGTNKDKHKSLDVVKALRKLVCQHPLEWDKKLFDDKNDFRSMSQDDFKRLAAEVELGDIWKEGGSRGIKDAVYEWPKGNGKKNYFWFAHPVYFIKHMDDAGLLSMNADNLIMVQNRVVALERLKPKKDKPENGETGGMYGKGGFTFCNHATFLTIQAVDGNYKQFIGNPNLYKDNVPPYWVLASLEEGEFKEKYSEYEYRISTLWYDILDEQAAHSGTTGICKAEAEEAQTRANQGYVVVAAWKNDPGPDNPPHYATVRPGYQYDSKDGPMFANVGGKNNADATAEQAFGETLWKEVMYYYNRNQVFINPVDDKNIKILEDGGHL
jgi:hypothetical protein